MKPEVEEIARCLASEARSRVDKRRGYIEHDDMCVAMDWLGFTKDAERLLQSGAKVILGKLVI